MKQLKDVLICSSSHYFDSVPREIEGFLAYWKGLLLDVPEEYRGSAYIRLQPAAEEYGGACFFTRVGYRREETRNERVLRVVAERSIEARERERELSTLRDLMQAFPLETKEILEQLTTDT